MAVGIKLISPDNTTPAVEAMRASDLTVRAGGVRHVNSPHRDRRVVVARLRQIVRRINVHQYTGVLHINGVRRVTRDESASAFVALQADKFRVKLGSKTHGVSAAAKVLGINDRVVLKLSRYRPQCFGLNHGHVARQHQPARGLRSR